MESIMILDRYEYIERACVTGNVAKDAEALMCRNGKTKTFEHMSDVAKVSVSLAKRFGADEEKCFTAAMLHDISAVIRPADMLLYIRACGSALCEAEERFPFLLHQRLSAVIAEEYFVITDSDILSAIACHTTLKSEASVYDMILFIADKLAWDQEGTPPFYDAVASALNDSLEKACYAYMCYMEESGRLLCPHTDWIEAKKWLSGK